MVDSLEFKIVDRKKPDDILTLLKTLEALARAKQEQEKAIQSTKNSKLNIEKKAEIEKKKDITVIVDDEDHKEILHDPFKDDLLSITLDMIGFEKFHIQQYQQQLANYARFLSEYLDGKKGIFKPQDSYTYTEQEEKQETSEVEMITFAEMQDYVRATNMNSLLGGTANYVDPGMKESWENWRVFQHNQIMSFYYTSQWRH
ncbi:MAG: hypothetical protein WC254_07735 [Candidatus Woesearchaeota archaeon]|jgi:hypothetical protein